MRHLTLITVVLLLPLTAFVLDRISNTIATDGQSQEPETPSKKTVSTADVTEVKWDDLVPPNYAPEDILGKYEKKLSKLKDDDAEAQKILEEIRQSWNNAPVVTAFEGKAIKIAGYVVPFEGDGKTVKEFLLVPYFGACIHSPPPPSNQIVYVLSPSKGVAVRKMFDTVWVTGTLRIDKHMSELAQAGYTLHATRVDPY